MILEEEEQMITHSTAFYAALQTACSLPQCRGHQYPGLGARLGDFAVWKPQKARGCWWAGYHRNHVLSHVAPDTARSWFGAYGSQSAHILGLLVAFWECFLDILCS